MENGYLSTMTKAQRTRGEGGERRPQSTLIKRTRGRPEIYEEEWIEKAAFMARNGATDVEMAKELGCSLDTFYRKANQYPEFSEAVRAGKAAFDLRVVNSFGRRAIGYEYESEKVFSNGFRAKVIEHVPADPGAALNWLVNRDPDRWRKRQETELIVPMGGEASEAGEIDVRTQALAALALFTEATYDDSPMIEGTAREETYDGEAAAPQAAEEYRPESGDDLEDDFDADIDIDD